MRTLSLAGLATLLFAGACYPQYGAGSTTPAMAPEPVAVAGPPGGGMDQGYDYQNPDQPGYPAGYPQGYGPGVDARQPQDPWADPSQAAPQPYGDPQQADPATGAVNDAEIDQTLQPYGQWVQDPDYGRVWRPDPSVVGENFTPYETAGSWVNTDYGATFSSDWDWGWLPFHYGQWEWFDGGYWGWCPDYVWGPGWVDWRYGGGYIGWRPQHSHRGPVIRDHRHPSHDAHWRFQSQRDFGAHNIHAHTFVNNAEGLRATSSVVRPPIRPIGPTFHAANVMRGRTNGRLAPQQANGAGPARWQPRPTYQQPNRGSFQQPNRGSFVQPSRPYPSQGRTYNPYQGPARTYQPPAGYQQPRTYQPPSRGSYQPPPSRGSYTPSRGTFTPPSRGSFTPPSRGSFSPPSRGSFTAPSHSSSSSSSSHSSSSSSHSSSSGSHSSGGGHHR